MGITGQKCKNEYRKRFLKLAWVTQDANLEFLIVPRQTFLNFFFYDLKNNVYVYPLMTVTLKWELYNQRPPNLEVPHSKFLG